MSNLSASPASRWVLPALVGALTAAALRRAPGSALARALAAVLAALGVAEFQRRARPVAIAQAPRHASATVAAVGRRLEGRCALVTGSSSGIGAGVAVRFAREGADVAVNHVPTDEGGKRACDSLKRDILALGRRCIVVAADVSKEADVNAMFQEVQREFGKLDILVNNAGIATGGGPVTDITVEAFDKLISVNLRGVFLCTRAAIPIMKANGYGRIVNTASQAAYTGPAWLSHYCASKGAIISFTRSVARELGRTNVRINTVAPGATMTPMMSGLGQPLLSAIAASIPLGTIAEVDEITPSYVFLASEEADYYLGQTISPNGGDCFL
mmetsp:Transcript_126038/g.288488  ORF Transcript_126038/g.288488 Transcript_126038/m.288488 type:complete len:328 (-) Transcript_126038:19-1002(-)